MFNVSISHITSIQVVSKSSAETIKDAIEKGANDSTPVNESFASPPAGGNYVRPTLLINVSHDMAIMNEETFGPVIPIMRVGNDEEAIRYADLAADPSYFIFKLSRETCIGSERTLLLLRPVSQPDLLPVMSNADSEIHIRLMNDSEFGLTASIWTKDTAKGEELAEHVEAGTVFVNRCDYPSPVSRFGV